MENISNNLKNIRQTISNSAVKSGRSESDITLVAVTKTRSQSEILQLKEEGVSIIGENRIQELASKFDYLKDSFKIHLIGHLQTNKAKQAVGMVDFIETIDSFKIASAVNTECEKLGKTMDILVQVNTSNEDVKSGVSPNGLDSLLMEISKLSHIKVQGLMTMAMFTTDTEMVRHCFKILKNSCDKAKSKKIENINLEHLSMGMSSDFEIAIEEGATMVRIGSSIFN